MVFKRPAFLPTVTFCVLLGNFNGAVNFTTCPKTPDVELGNETAIITYGGKDNNIECSWTIPNNVQKKRHFVVLLLEEVMLPRQNADCAGELYFPGNIRFTCDLNNRDCWAYTTAKDGCDISEIKAQIPNKEINCASVKYWNLLRGNTKIMYSAYGNRERKQFTIHYYPLSCAIATTTAKPTTTSSTRGKTLTSSSPTESTKQQTSIIASQESTATNHESTVESSGSDSQQTVIIIAVVVPVTFLLLLIIAFVVFQRCSKQSNAPPTSNHQPQSNKGESKMVVNEIYDMENTDEMPQMTTSQIYESSNTTMQEEFHVYAEVNIPK